ncbi:MAG: sulfatase-like hydrolase/transferase, partial [Planctomycetes bacterium]|nr:sulfatase-like hydrolase/transferase [Planctomycetota bacterium]
KPYPVALKEAGYYVINTGKKDYNISNYDNSTWHGRKLNWKTLKENQPFFQVINSTKSHESQAMSTKYSTHDPARVKIPPYHPDVEGIRANYTSYYESITRMDTEIGQCLKQLEDSGMAENTIVIHNSDHGGPLPRGKRFMYNSGTHCPLIIRIPEKFKYLWPNEKPGTKVDRLVSFIDMPSTWISLAGGKVPTNYQGDIFLGPDADEEREYHLSFRGRNDERVESARAIRTKRFLYVKNYIPYVPRGQHLNYQWLIPAQRIWEEEYKAGRTNADQSRFFNIKPEHEFYDTDKDPYCLNNLAENPEFKTIVAKYKSELQKKQCLNYDAAFLPETELDRIAAENKITVYEVLRNKKLYDIKNYQTVADVALMNDPHKVPQLIEFLGSADVGVRYWGAVGLMMLDDKAAPAKQKLLGLLNDTSHNVRLMAAWSLVKLGEKEMAYASLNALLKENSYAMLEILNVIDNIITSLFEGYRIEFHITWDIFS